MTPYRPHRRLRLRATRGEVLCGSASSSVRRTALRWIASRPHSGPTAPPFRSLRALGLRRAPRWPKGNWSYVSGLLLEVNDGGWPTGRKLVWDEFGRSEVVDVDPQDGRAVELAGQLPHRSLWWSAVIPKPGVHAWAHAWPSGVEVSR